MKNQVAKWLTAVMPGRAWGVVFSLAALTAMGLVFLWCCPDAASFTERMGEHWMLKRQAVWLGIGFSAFAFGLILGWRRWMKAAPWLALGWLALFVIAICYPQVVVGVDRGKASESSRVGRSSGGCRGGGGRVCGLDARWP